MAEITAKTWEEDRPAPLPPSASAEELMTRSENLPESEAAPELAPETGSEPDTKEPEIKQAPAPSTQTEVTQTEAERTEAERVQELRDAIALATSGAIEGTEADTPEYWQSVEDVKQKLSIAEQISQAEQSWKEAGQEPPPEVAGQIQQAKTLVYGAVAPFIDLAGQKIDVASALKVGVPEEQILAAGVSEEVVRRASAENYIRKQYKGDPLKAIEGGDIEAVRTVYGGLQTVDLQKALADRREWERTVLPQMPEEYQKAYRTGDTATMDKLANQYTVSQQEFERWINSDKAPANLRQAYKDKGITGYEAEVAKQEAALQRLSAAGFVDKIPSGSYMKSADTPSLREYTIPDMAEFVRNNPDGMKILQDALFNKDVLDAVSKYNNELSSAIGRVDTIFKNSDTRYGGEELSLGLALTKAGITDVPGAHTVEGGTMGGIVVDDKTGKALTQKEQLERRWSALSIEDKAQIAPVWDADFRKGSYFSEISKGMEEAAAGAGVLGTIAYGPILPVTTPIAKQLTLKDAKAQLAQTYETELASLRDYVKTDGTFDTGKLNKALSSDKSLADKLLTDTGYKNIEDLDRSLEYYNYSTTVTAKEWVTGGLVAALDIMTIGMGPGAVTGAISKGVPQLPLLGFAKAVAQTGVPATLGAIMIPDTVRAIRSADTSLDEKILAGVMTGALLSGAVLGAGTFAFKEIRQFVKPGTFEPSGVSLEVSIPRAQLRADMTPTMAKTLLGDLERVYGGKLPEWVNESFIKSFRTPEQAQLWLSEFVKFDILTGQVKTIYTEVGKGAGAIKGRSNPLQAALGQKILFSIKPDIDTYIARVGKTGKDVTPAGSMEWWSPNFSGDVAGWYLGKVEKYSPGGKMLRFSDKDIRSWVETDVFKSVAGKLTDRNAWRQAKIKAYKETARATGGDPNVPDALAESGGDSVTAMNILVRDEIYRRSVLPPGHPDALPQGIYPVFKFHWSREPSGQVRPTWELEMVTPAGFEANVFKPVRYLDTIKTGGVARPEIASLTVRSPVQGKDMVTGQMIRLDQPMPVAITATRNAMSEGVGVPKLSEVYAAKYKYRPIVAIQNIFDQGRAIRPRATEGMLVTTPRKWYSRAIKFESPKENPADVSARKVLSELPSERRLSTPELAAKVEGTKVDAYGRLSVTREPYYHPVREFADNWVVPRAGVMLEHPTIKGAYVVVTDTSSAAQPGVWDIIGGQIDVRGKPRVNRPFGKISVQEAAREQILSELGVDVQGIRPAEIHMGKTTEHSAFGTYMFDGKPSSLKFNIPMNKWYDMTKGEWVIEPEVGAVRVLRSGDKAAVTPALYVELSKRGFDTSNLTVVDEGLPTAGIRQYPKGSRERVILDKAKVARKVDDVDLALGNKDILFRTKGEVERIKAFKDAWSKEVDVSDFVVPTTSTDRIVTGLVPTLRPVVGEASAITIETISTPDAAIARMGSREVLPSELSSVERLPSIERLPVSLESAIGPDRTPVDRTLSDRTLTTISRVSPESTPRELAPEPTPEPSPETASKATPRTIPEPTPRVATVTETTIRTPELPRTPRVPEAPSTPRVPKTPRVPPPLLPPPTVTRFGTEITGDKARLPEGSITWKQGFLYRWIPYQDWVRGAAKPRALPRGVTPIGAIRIGKTPAETVQMIGDPGASVPDIAVDLGVTDIFISDQAQTIQYTGKGRETNVGAGVPSNTQGMTVEGGGEAKGHAYAKGKEMPEQVTRELREGINRPRITEYTDKIQEEPYAEPVAEPIAAESQTRVVPKATRKRVKGNAFSDLVSLTDEDMSDIFGVDTEKDIMGSYNKRKPINRARTSKKRLSRKGSSPTAVREVRL